MGNLEQHWYTFLHLKLTKRVRIILGGAVVLRGPPGAFRGSRTAAGVATTVLAGFFSTSGTPPTSPRPPSDASAIGVVDTVLAVDFFMVPDAEEEFTSLSSHSVSITAHKLATVVESPSHFYRYIRTRTRVTFFWDFYTLFTAEFPR